MASYRRSTRAIRLEVDWKDREWLYFATAEVRLAWIELMCWVKTHGKRGRCRAPVLQVLGRQSNLSVAAVEEALSLALRAGEITTADGDIVVLEWERFETERKQIPPHVRRIVMQRDRHRCTRCGIGTDLTLDHIVPYSLGGSDDPDNLRVYCRPCNSRRGNRVEA